jgi:hypothetical protein
MVISFLLLWRAHYWITEAKHVTYWGLCDFHAVCVSVKPPYQLLNSWTNHCETRFAYHENSRHPNSVFHKYLPLVCVCVCVCIYIHISRILVRQRHFKQVPAENNAGNNKKVVGNLHLWVCPCILMSLLGNINKDIPAKMKNWRRWFACGPCRKIKSKARPIGCETSRIPYCLNNRLLDGGDVVSITYRLHSTLQKYYMVLISGRGWVNSGATVRPEGIHQLKKYSMTTSGLKPSTFRLIA